MCSIIAGVLDMTVGLLWRKARDHTANKLKEGDLTAEQCRQLIVRELENMKTKIDGLARKDLLASINFLEEGFIFLRDDSNPRKSTTMLEQRVDGAYAASLMGNVRSKLRHSGSNENYSTAKESLKESNKKATEAFSNEALSIEDRIMATKLRVVSRMFLNIENPEGAIEACILYLEKLHGLSAIEQMFTVYLDHGWKSRLNAKQRRENVLSVTTINFVLAEFCMKFGGMTFLELLSTFWPAIEIGGESSSKYNPILTKEKFLKSMDCAKDVRNKVRTFKARNEGDLSVVNSTGATIGIAAKSAWTGELFRTNASCDEKEETLFCSLPSEDTKQDGFQVVELAIDHEDNIDVLTTMTPLQTPDCCCFTLFRVDPNGEIKNKCSLEFLDGPKDPPDTFTPPRIATSKDNKIVFFYKAVVYVCERGETLGLRSRFKSDCVVVDACISDSDEIAIYSPEPPTNAVFVYTMGGKLVKKLATDM